MEHTQEPNSTSISENTPSDLVLTATVGNLFKLIVYSIVFLFGVPGNCLILRVYWTKTLKTSTHVFVMGLAWADLAVCVLDLHRIYSTVAQITVNDVHEFTFFIKALEGIAIGTSVMMTAVIAADRYDCICRPHSRFFTHKRGKKAAWAAFVFSLVINIPGFIPITPGSSYRSFDVLRLVFQVIFFVVALVMIALCYGKVYMTIKEHTKVGVKSTTRGCSVSRSADKCSTKQQDSVFTNVQPNISAVASVSTFIKPCSSTAADSSRMVESKGVPSHEIDKSTLDESRNRWASHPQVTLTKHVLVLKDTQSRVAKRNTDTTQHQGNAGRPPPKTNAAVLQRKTTRMLFITSVVFLLTWLPYWMRLAATIAFYSDPVFNTIILPLSVTLYVNNAVNPLIYGLANRRFRKDCKTVLSNIRFC